jgi:membrane protease YdiL (CAAX protease family)
VAQVEIEDPARRSTRPRQARRTAMSAGQRALNAPPSDVTRHRAGLSVLLHLAPGAAAMAVYVAAVPLVRDLGLPTIAALALSGLFGVLPVQLGLIALHRRRHPAEATSRLQHRLPLRRVLGLSLVEVVLAAVAFALTAPLGPWLRASLFGWWPEGWVLDPGTHPGVSRGALVVTALLMLLGSVIAAPVVEERYFRGYLLPRMPARLGRLTALGHAALFAGYHLWTPWLAPARILAVVPLAVIALRTRDIRIGVVTHVLLNAVDLALLVHFLLGS